MAGRVVLFFAALTIPLSAQHRETNPFGSAQDLAEGKRLYRTNCGVCHGMEGKTGRGARLAVRNHRHGDSDAELFRVVQNGIPGTEMPGLWLDEDSIWKILLFVRTLEINAGEACSATPGDAERGAKSFEQTCRGCHMVGREGGRLGPALTYVGLNYSRDQLRDALLKPDKDIGNRFRAVEVTTKSGESFGGVLLNEDGYTVHLMDRQENLRSFDRTDLLTVKKPAKSLMPSYAGLGEAEIEDLLAYMCGLRGGEQ